MGELRGTRNVRSERLQLLQCRNPLPALHEQACIGPRDDGVVVPLQVAYHVDMWYGLLAALEIEQQIHDATANARIVGQDLNAFDQDIERRQRLPHRPGEVCISDDHAGVVGVGGQSFLHHLRGSRVVLGSHRDLELCKQHLRGIGGQLDGSRDLDPRGREIVVEDAPRRHRQPGAAVSGIDFRQPTHDPRCGGRVVVATGEDLGDEEVGIGTVGQRFPGGVERLRAEIEADQFRGDFCGLVVSPHPRAGRGVTEVDDVVGGGRLRFFLSLGDGLFLGLRGDRIRQAMIADEPEMLA